MWIKPPGNHPHLWAPSAQRSRAFTGQTHTISQLRTLCPGLRPQALPGLLAPPAHET